MKKIILAAALFFMSAPLYAYFYFEPGDIVIYPSVSAKLYGYTFDKNTDVEIDQRGGASWSAGVLLDLFLSDALSFTTGMYYDKASEEYKVYSSGNRKLKAEFTFLTVPVGLHYYFYDFHFIGAGCYYGKMRNKNFTDSSNSFTLVDSEHSKNDIGVWVQLGYAVEISDYINMLLYAGGKRSLVSVYENNTSLITNLKMYEISFSAALGLRF